MGALFYGLNRHQFSDISLSRWIQILLLIGIGSALLRWSLAGWIAAALLGAALAAFVLASIHWKRRAYVRFEETTRPTVAPAPLPPQAKIPVYASGTFGVEGKFAQFAWLQGFFRTFATREHALLCLVQSSRFALFGSRPEKELGMWYIFFKDQEIEQVRWGTIHHGNRSLPGLAISHRIFVPARSRFDRDKTWHKTAYIGCTNEADARRILADLLCDQEMAPAGSPSHNGAGRLPTNQQEWRRIDG